MSAETSSNKHVIRIVIDGHEKLASVEKDEFLLGRDPAADVLVEHAKVSRRHISVRIADGKLYVKDLGSTLGTFFGKKQLRPFQETLCATDAGPLMLSNIVAVSISPAPGKLVAPTAAETAAPKDNAPEKEAFAGKQASPAKMTVPRKPPVRTGDTQILAPVTGEKTDIGIDPAAKIKEAALAEAQEIKRKVLLEVEVVQAEGVKAIEDLKHEASKQADLAREEALKTADKIVSDARREAETLRESILKGIEKAKAEIETLTANREKLSTECKRQTERIAAVEAEARNEQAKLEAERGEAEAKLKTVQAEVDAAKQEKSGLEHASGVLRAVIERLEKSKVEAEKEEQESKKILESMNSEHERVNEEFRDLVKSVAAVKEEIEKESAALKKLLDDRKMTVELYAIEDRKRQITIDALDAEYRGKKLALEATVGEVELRRIEAEQVLQSLTGRKREKEEETARLIAQADERVRAQNERNGKLKKENSELDAENKRLNQAVKESSNELDRLAKIVAEAKAGAVGAEEARQRVETLARNEREEFERQARESREALDAELSALRAKVTQELDTEQKAVRDEIRTSRERMTREMATLRENTMADLERETRTRRADLEREIKTTREEVENESLAKKAELERETKAMQEELERETASRRDELEREIRTRKLELEQESIARKEELEREMVSRREQFERELQEKIDTADAAFAAREREASNRQQILEAEIARLTQDRGERIQSLELEMNDKARAMERDLAEARLKELEKIKGTADEERKAQRSRTKFMVDEVTHIALELSKTGSLSQFEPELRKAVRSILEGKTAAAVSAQAAERSRVFWRKVAIYAAGPVAAILFLAIFPQVPGKISDSISRGIASYKKDSDNTFLAEIKARGMKYQPAMDTSYRRTYSDNILYLEHYAEMKLDEKEQKPWTLLVNDFLVGRLGLSDAVIADFIGAEMVLVKELIRVREGILPQFKDQGITRLDAVEKEFTGKMRMILQSDENFQKFRGLEKSYYEDYLRRKSGIAARAASTPTAAPASLPAIGSATRGPAMDQGP